MPPSPICAVMSAGLRRVARRVRRRGDAARRMSPAQAALYRGLELFDLMLDDPRHRASVARLREIARAREVVVDFLAGANEYGSTGPSLQKYFDQFALAARRAHLAG